MAQLLRSLPLMQRVLGPGSWVQFPVEPQDLFPSLVASDFWGKCIEMTKTL